MLAREHRAFATALGSAMSLRGVSAHDLETLLFRRGHKVPTDWISNWRSGRSLPRRGSTLQAVREIERELRLSKDDLLAPLRSDMLAEQAIARGRNPLARIAEPEYADRDIIRKFATMNSDVRWDGEVHREALTEEVLISADFHSVLIRNSIIVRYGPNPRPTMHISIFWDEDNPPPADDDIGIYEIDGATVGKVRTRVESFGIGKTTSLMLPKGEEGTLHRLYYEQRYTSEPPLTETATRSFPFPISVYTGKVIFEGEVPPKLRFLQSRTDDAGIEKIVRTRPLEPFGNSVQASAEDVVHATALFRWDLPAGIARSAIG